ncbi:MAG TPA: FadR/GntR family transcriptional regulator [Gaiellaceae bacterium]|nr:FadR/GntR family transcriptional regulator [Gaiellaceae bacterium]
MEASSRPSAGHGLLARDGKGSRRPGRLASVVVEELTNEIIGGTLREGEVLPTEPALCEEFGFSRTVVREALKLLEERGLVRVEQGRGTTVQPRDAWNLLDPVVLRIALAYDADLSLLDNMIAVRQVMEREMARAAAGRLTDAELAALADSVDRMEASYDDYERFRSCDNEFHSIVMKASGNEVGVTIVRAIHRHGGVTPPLSAGASRTALARTVAAHRAIHAALTARDGELAGQLISDHIHSAWAERKRRRPARRTATAAR